MRRHIATGRVEADRTRGGPRAHDQADARAAPRRQRLQHLHPGADGLLAGAHGPVAPAPVRRERHLLPLYDNLICVVFLIDFAINLAGAKPKSAYFVGDRGWLDLLGSIPTFGFLPFTAMFRLARLSRLARITRLLRGQAGKDLVVDVLKNRSQYATFITILLAVMVLSDRRASSSSNSRAGRRTPTSRPAATPSGGAS